MAQRTPALSPLAPPSPATRATLRAISRKNWLASARDIAERRERSQEKVCQVPFQGLVGVLGPQRVV
eukprot:1981992-Alexandrium_andersonii.AAC.1